MKTLLVLCVCIGAAPAAAAFGCIGQNNSCALSHVKCDTGFDPFCEHLQTVFGMRFGICTCDKECTSAVDCSNDEVDVCPPMSYPVCDTMHKVCHCSGVQIRH